MPQPSDMSPEKYREMRDSVDTRRACARALGVSYETLTKRETGKRAIGIEAELAMRYLTRHGLPRYLRDRKNKNVIEPADVTWGTPGELREALTILGMGPSEGARFFFGPGETARRRMSQLCSGARRISEDEARMVKRRLGLRLDEPWPKREAVAWDNADEVIASLQQGGR